MGSGNNCTTDFSEWRHIANVKEAYRFTNKVRHIRHMFKHNNWCTTLDCMGETLSRLTFQGWYPIDTAKFFNQLSATDNQQNTPSAHLFCGQDCHKQLFSRPVSQQVYHLKETHVRNVCRSIKLTSLSVGSEDFGIPVGSLLFCT
jgi:hypothetical protein